MRVDVAASLLRRCSNPGGLIEARRLHADLRASGLLDRSTYIANLLILTYSACRSPNEAQSAFESAAAPRNIFSWTILLQSLAQNHRLHHALAVLQKMPQTDSVAWNSLISAHGRASDLENARRIFEAAPERDLVSWNSLVAAFSQNGEPLKALGIFRLMDLEGAAPDSCSFSTVLDAISDLAPPDAAVVVDLSREVEVQDFHKITSVGTALLSAQGKIGDISGAKRAFDQIRERNAISWNAMIAAYARNTDPESAREIFLRMPQRDVISGTAVAAAYAQQNRFQESKEIFDEMPQRDLAAWNSLMFVDSQSTHLTAAKAVFDKSPQHDLASRTSMLVICALSGDLAAAVEIFDRTSVRDVPFFNAMITALLRNGLPREALEIFGSIDRPPPDRLSLLLAIDAAAATADPSICHRIHLRVSSTGFISDLGICAAMIRMFARAGEIEEAESVFLRMNRCSELWNAMICSYCFCGLLREATNLFERMPSRDSASWVILVRGFALNGHLQSAAELMRKMPQQNPAACNSVLSGYVSIGDVEKARAIFDEIQPDLRTVPTWNLMVSGYAQCGYVGEILKLLREMMLKEDTQPDRATFLAALDSCVCRSTTVEDCREIHSLAAASRRDSDLCVATGIVNAYGKCRSVEEAKTVFDSIPEPSVVSGNCMLRAYAQSGHMDGARDLFESMLVRDVVSWNTLAAGYALGGHTDAVARVRTAAPAWDCVSCNAAMLACASEGRVWEARGVFDSVRGTESGLVTSLWNGMCGIYIQAGMCREAVELHWEMNLEGVNPDRISFLSLFDAYGKMTALGDGRLLHSDVRESRWRSDQMLSNAIVNFYGKCGCVGGALRMFESMPVQDIVSWNGLGAAYAQNGYIREAEVVLWCMSLHGMSPDEVSYVNLLSACSHAGMVKDGRQHFHCLVGDYWIKPTLDHFMCVADLLGRLGRLEECEELIGSMPYEPGWVGWMTLLGACRVHGDVEIGRSTVSRFCHTGAAGYVLLSNLYLD